MYIYVLSTGRTGTNFLLQQFQKQFPNLEISHQQRGSRIINIVANLPLKKTINTSFLVFLFKFFNRGYPPRSTLDPLLSMALYYLIKHKGLNNNSYIIHLVRDPRTFVTSFMNWKNSSLRKLTLHHLIPFWQPSPRFDNNLPIQERLEFNKFKQFCYVWQYKNSLFYNTFAEYDNYLLVRFEDLTNPSFCNSKFSELYDFLNLTKNNDIDIKQYLTGKVNTSTENSFSDYKDWPEDRKKYLEKMCGPLMREFGYF